MSAPSCQVWVLSRDAELLARVVDALGVPEFSVRAFAEPAAAESALAERGPDVVLSGVLDEEGDGAFKPLRRHRRLLSVLWTVLAPGRGGDALVDVMEDAADDLLEDLDAVALQVKVLAAWRATARLREAVAPPPALAGRIADAGLLPLLQLCEKQCFTGRLRVQHAEGVLEAELRGGQLASADDLDALLAVRDGRFQLEHGAFDARGLAVPVPAATPAPAAAEVPCALPGRNSRLERAGTAYDVQTEARCQPVFSLTTVVLRAGQVLQRVESAWPQPLQRREELAVAREQMDAQHERVLAEWAPAEAAAPPPEPAPAPPAEVELLPLTWALYFVVEEVVTRLGAEPARALLERTRADARGGPLLAPFKVSAAARVELAAGGRAPRQTVAAVARWIALFLGQAADLGASGIDVRQATRLMDQPLDALGFYAALAEARPGSGVVQSFQRPARVLPNQRIGVRR